MRIAIAALVLIGLGVGVWLLWPDGRDDQSPPPEAGASTSTTGPSLDETTTTTTVAPTTSSTVPESHVVETVEEAEEILRELWFGWFEGIYNEDEERIREVVGNPDLVQAATDQFGSMDFAHSPVLADIGVSGIEILRGDESCLAVWATVDASELMGESNDGVFVFLYGDNWKFISQWASGDDLWANDCDSQL